MSKAAKQIINKKKIVGLICTLNNAVLYMDDLEGESWLFKQDLKQTAKNLSKKIEKKIDKIFEADIHEDDTLKSSVDQLVNVSRLIERLTIMCISIDEIHLGGFQNDFKALCKKYRVDDEIINEIFEV